MAGRPSGVGGASQEGFEAPRLIKVYERLWSHASAGQFDAVNVATCART